MLPHYIGKQTHTKDKVGSALVAIARLPCTNSLQQFCKPPHPMDTVDPKLVPIGEFSRVRSQQQFRKCPHLLQPPCFQNPPQWRQHPHPVLGESMSALPPPTSTATASFGTTTAISGIRVVNRPPCETSAPHTVSFRIPIPNCSVSFANGLPVRQVSWNSPSRTVEPTIFNSFCPKHTPRWGPVSSMSLLKTGWPFPNSM